MQRLMMLLLVIPLSCIFLTACNPRKITETPSDITNPLINQEVGSLFLAKNKLNPEIFIQPSGLQYFVIKAGSGIRSDKNDFVTLYYQGRYIDGHVFDNQHSQNDPVTIRVATLIPGLQEAITLMRSGSIWMLYIPPHLAFGDKGIPGIIGPRQTLIYTVNLVTIKKDK